MLFLHSLEQKKYERTVMQGVRGNKLLSQVTLNISMISMNRYKVSTVTCNSIILASLIKEL